MQKITLNTIIRAHSESQNWRNAKPDNGFKKSEDLDEVSALWEKNERLKKRIQYTKYCNLITPYNVTRCMNLYRGGYGYI